MGINSIVWVGHDDGDGLLYGSWGEQGYHIEAAWIWLRFTGGKIAGLDTLELKAVF